MLLLWLLQEVGSNWTEISAATLLEEYRMEQEVLKDLLLNKFMQYLADFCPKWYLTVFNIVPYKH